MTRWTSEAQSSCSPVSQRLTVPGRQPVGTLEKFMKQRDRPSDLEASPCVVEIARSHTLTADPKK